MSPAYRRPYQRAYTYRGMGAPPIPTSYSRPTQAPILRNYPVYGQRSLGPQNAGILGDSGSPVTYRPGYMPQTEAVDKPKPQREQTFHPQGAPAGLGPISFEDDPLLARVKALNQKLVSSAEAAALASKKRALIEFGSPELVTQLLGGKEGGTAEAARQNPFSTLAQLLQTHNENQLSIDETRNKQNLFYSTTRATDLTGEQKGYLQGQASAQADLDERIASYQQAVLDAQLQAQNNLLQAEEDAYGRALQIALANAAAASSQQWPYGDGGTQPTPESTPTPTPAYTPWTAASHPVTQNAYWTAIAKKRKKTKLPTGVYWR